MERYTRHAPSSSPGSSLLAHSHLNPGGGGDAHSSLATPLKSSPSQNSASSRSYRSSRTPPPFSPHQNMHGVDGSSPNLSKSVARRNRSLGEIEFYESASFISSSTHHEDDDEDDDDHSAATSRDVSSIALDMAGDKWSDMAADRCLDRVGDGRCLDSDTGIEVNTNSDVTILDTTRSLYIMFLYFRS